MTVLRLTKKLLPCGKQHRLMKLFCVKYGISFFYLTLLLEFWIYDILRNSPWYILFVFTILDSHANVVAVLKSSCQNRPLTEDELSRIDCNQETLMELMDTDEILNHLTADGCLTRRQRLTLEIKQDPYERNQTLIEMFKRKSVAEVQKLGYWLESTRQGHVAKLLKEDGS